MCLIGKSFSPLFIGARNVTRIFNELRDLLPHFQSPFHRGKECYTIYRPIASHHHELSVPFSSGQGMLHARGLYGFSILCLSVPFSSGQGMLQTYPHVLTHSLHRFQSPFHRGKECYYLRRIEMFGVRLLSVPFSSGQGMLRRFREERMKVHSCLSVPFSSGQGMLLTARASTNKSNRLSVPFSSGQGMLLRNEGRRFPRFLVTFSPLFIGARNVTAVDLWATRP